MALPHDNTNSFSSLASYHGISKRVCYHSHELFLNWHRKYVLKFENALRTIEGCEDVSLPYLPAEKLVDKSKTVPAWLYKKPFDSFEVPKEFHDAVKKFEDAMEVKLGTTTFRESSDIIAENLKANVVSLQQQIDDFVTPGIWKNIAISGVENPHGIIHDDIGGWMAHVATAAFDPIFWMHHCNVERWYCEWQLKNDCITVESMNKRSGETVNGSHQIPWE